jgi:manganese-transporting P-type ATPase
MYLGILAVSGLAFACSTEFMPEVNEKMRLVPFSDEFKLKLTVTMVVDYAGCWIVEKVLKFAFSDYKPKDIAVRRPEQYVRDEARQNQDREDENQRKADEAEKREIARLEALERKKQELRERWGLQQ